MKNPSPLPQEQTISRNLGSLGPSEAIHANKFQNPYLTKNPEAIYGRVLQQGQAKEAAIDRLFAEKMFPEGPEKCLNFLSYVMKKSREGHLCIVLSEILEPDLLEGASQLPDSLFNQILVRQNNRIYLRRNWECEQNFLAHLSRIRSDHSFQTIHVSSQQMSELNPDQQAAVLKTTNQSLTLISGGPGTGKTFTAAVMIRLFLKLGLKKIAVAAPTGKAAARMRIALGNVGTQCSIQTLHTLLKSQPIYADLILIDEASMVDAEIMTTLFRAIRKGSRLILLGDRHQLPPVESGHFFADLAQDCEIAIELKTSLRTELKEITDWASAVKKGESIPSHPLPDLKQLIPMMIEKQGQILTPLRKGLYGSDYLNQLLHQEYSKRGQTKIPILITLNDPFLDLYNGDTGLLDEIQKEAHFPDGRRFKEHLLPPYEYSYALSVHKSQGSEYDKVIILLPEGSEVFGREMLYTAITRAKKEVTIFSHPGVLENVIQNKIYRASGLLENCL